MTSVESRTNPPEFSPALFKSEAIDSETAVFNAQLATKLGIEFGSTRLSIGGPSVGAHLAVVTLLRLREKHQLRSLSRANLVFGAYDPAMTPSAQQATDT
jgi:acetyl esterase/lipase